MSMGNIFAIGDIHGCFQKLVKLMEIMAADPLNDTLVFLGDYIDRGPDSSKVIDYLLKIKASHANSIFLKGNHEEMFENYLADTNKLDYLMNGGQHTIDSYLRFTESREELILPQAHTDFFESLLPYYETEDYIFVHAGLRKKKPLKGQDMKDLLWIRDEFIETDFNFGKRVIFGHTPFPKPLVQSNKIGIDTGVFFGNKLTGLKLPEIQFFQV